MSLYTIHQIIPVAGVLGLIFSFVIYLVIVRQPSGNARMQEIASEIQTGAMAFLKRMYAVLALFVVIVASLLAWKVDGATAAAFVFGAICSVGAGFFGMKAATKANVRTAAAAKDRGQGAALLVAFNGGAVMGLAVASLGLIGVGALYLYLGPNPAHAAV